MKSILLNLRLTGVAHTWFATLAFTCCMLWAPYCSAGSAFVSSVWQDESAVTEEPAAEEPVAEEPAEVPVGALAQPREVEAVVPEIVQRAWELHPYQVLVWICHSGSPRLNAIQNSLDYEILRQAELIDPSGWLVYVQSAPPEWRNKLLRSIDHPDQLTGIADAPQLQNADKLMVVCLEDREGQLDFQVREFDIKTQQWGAMVSRSTAQTTSVHQSVFQAITKAFMPLARVDRVTEEGEVIMRARAVMACEKAAQTDDGEWVLEKNTNSPVWVRLDDRFLPVIRRVDRKGDLAKLEAIDFTFLTIDQQNDFVLNCKIHSYHRAPLSGRTSRRAQKLALVIRPPETPTQLKLVSRDDEKNALAGYEIWSRRPGMTRDEKSEYLGSTDWRGILDIPPHADDGLRLIYVKRGNRALKKLPIIPGLYSNLQTTVPNDETRLYAQGIISGFQNEILNLVAQRQVYEVEIETALKEKDYELASELLEKYSRLTSPQDVKARMADEEIRLKAQTVDQRELGSISGMFGILREALSARVGESTESDLRARLQAARQAEAASQ
ncbi:MAG: hypothetical protein MK108_08695 [Mariniblastus sp.]|nr:hypothetical protein [Mariniblastus sp.]